MRLATLLEAKLKGYAAYHLLRGAPPERVEVWDVKPQRGSASRSNHASLSHMYDLWDSFVASVQWVTYRFPDDGERYYEDNIYWVAYAPTQAGLKMHIKEVAQSGDFDYDELNDPATVLSKVKIVEVGR